MTDPGISEIGKYKIVGLLGEGAMGVVYRATDSVIGRIVAVKVMSESIARHPELRQRFMHEAQAAGSMQHPNIISLYDLGELEGHLYIVMEYVEGVDLEQLISSRKPLTLQTKLDIIIDVLAGLSYAHKRGIVHRDIKPANIRIAEDGRAKIMDFGVAHLSTSELTVTGSVVGTPAYMAPEQITGSRTTPATDLFAAGAVLYELVTGAKAFSAPTIQSLYFKIVSEPPVPIVEVLPGLPPELNRIIGKALEKDPKDRYATALDMANDLTQLRATLSDATRPGTMSLSATVARQLAQQKQPERKRNRPLVIGGAALGLVVIAAGLFAMTRRKQPENTAPPVTKIVADSATAPRTEEQKVEVVPAPPAPVVEESPVIKTRGREKPSPPPPPARAKKSEAPVVRAPVLPTPPAVTRVAPQPQPQAPPPPPPPPAPAPAPSSVQPSPPPSPPAAPAPSASGVRALVQDYAHAIEQRDIAGIRSVYPGLTPSEQSNWENFFREARRVKVALQVRGVEVNGNSAQARLTGTYDYEDSAGRPQPTIRVSNSVSLRHDGTAWHIVSIRGDYKLYSTPAV
jgi:serine/threonine-protein kinase